LQTNLLKHTGNVDIISGAGLDKFDAVAACEFAGFTETYLSLFLFAVALVAYDYFGHRLGMAVVDLFDPVGEIVEGPSFSNRVDKDDSSCSFIIRLSYSFEALLACSVPDLHFDVESIDWQDFYFEVYTNSGDVVEFELIVDETEKDVGFSDCSVSDDDEFDHVIIAFIRAFGLHFSDSYKLVYTG